MPEAVEMLRCPTCLSLLFEADAKRCPACHSKLRKRSRPTVLVETSALADRPLPLVERELQARIEAETAARFRQRRRAAKVARRIAALPPTALAGDLVLIPEETVPEPPVADPRDEAPEVIDLPAESVHDVTSVAEHAYVPRASVVEVAPVVDVEPEPVVAVIEPEPEPVVAPAAKPRKPRRRTFKAARIEGLLDDVALDATAAEPVVEPVVAEAVVAEPAVEAPLVVEPIVVVEPEPVVVVEPDPEPEVVVPEVVVPEVAVPEVVIPEVVEAAAPEPEVVPEPEIVEAVPAANWTRSNSVWTQRVFNTAPRARQAETVAWPPQWKPAAPLIDLTDDSESEPADASR